MSEISFTSIRLERREPGLAIVRIARPQALNALNTVTLRELREALRQLATDSSARVVVLAGEGEKAFIAGADITEMKDKSTSEGVEFSQVGHEVTKLLELMPKPTIAAVNGFALGGGTEMAIACDFILASETAVFGQPEVGLGIIPGFGATARLAKFVGFPRAKELIFTGRKFKADEALRLGLVAEVIPSSEFWDRVLAVATGIARQSSTAIAKSKSLLNEFSESVGLHMKLDAEAQAFGGLFGTADQREGMTAFVEKRKPLFQGL
jgi:enoyl-CoA hydratase